MKEKLDLLANLQGIEIEMQKLEAILEGIPNHLDALEEKKQNFQRLLDEESKAVEDEQKKYRTLELDFKQSQTQIEQSEIKLRAVKTNKEYQATLKEIEELKSKGSAMEDEMLQCLERIEETEGTIAQKQKDFVQIAHQIDAEKKEFQQKGSQTEQQHLELKSRRDAVAEDIPQNILDKYQYVKTQYSDRVAIVRVVNAVCVGCHMNIPPQMFIELQRQDRLMECPQCQRLIYWHQQKEEETA
jgi:uncharacterized protein